MNHMAEVAKMFGVALNEQFQCKDNKSVFCFTQHGLLCNGCYASDCLTLLLTGSLVVERNPYRPMDDQVFYYVDHRGAVRADVFDDDYFVEYANYYKIGNCYHTKEEAEANRDKWMEFYASDKVLEV